MYKSPYRCTLKLTAHKTYMVDTGSLFRHCYLRIR